MIPGTPIKTLTEERELREIIYTKLIIVVFVYWSSVGSSSYFFIFMIPHRHLKTQIFTDFHELSRRIAPDKI